MTGDNSFVHPVQFDQLNVETPELVELRFPVAGLGSRFLAATIDVLLIVAFYLVLLIVFAIAASGTAGSNTSAGVTTTAEKWFVAGIIFVNFAMVWGYFSLFEGLWHGQTPGKRWMKVRVIKDTGRAITLFEAMARNLLRVVDLLPGFYLAGVITMLCNRSQKRLGDLVAGTIVIHERTDDGTGGQPTMGQHQSRTFTANLYEEAPVLRRLKPMGVEAEEPVSEVQVPADAIAKLGNDDLHLIDTFFSRALDLTVERRAALAARVAGTICGKMGIELPQGMAPERLLEVVAYRMRGQGRF
jgi:uncharacterized RDD family membrane protein YckC